MIKSMPFKNFNHFNKNHATLISGNVTIILSLTIMLIISLLFTILESARLVSVKTHFTDITYNSLDSLFGNYCKELFDDYGIFAINPGDVDLQNYLLNLGETNAATEHSILNVSSPSSGFNLLKGHLSNLTINQTTSITDNDGLIFSEQVKAFMQYKELGTLADNLTDSFNETSENVYDFLDEENNASLDYSLLDTPYTEDRRDCLDISTSEAKQYSDDLKSTIAHALKDNLIYLIVEDPSKVSTTKIDKSILPSTTVQLSEAASTISEGYIKEQSSVTLERIYFEEYVSSMFGCYTQPKENSLLSYELEYIINGSDSDDSNLLSTALKLITMRASFNIVHIISDSKKRTAVNDLAKLVVNAASAVPFALPIAEMIIASSWATAEGIIDVRDLLSGKKVPLLKDESNWTISLSGIKALAPGTESNNSGESGFSYKYYLKLLILAQSELALRFRTMDLIQMNMCLKYNETFRLSNCICAIDTTFTYETPNVFFKLNNLAASQSTKFDIPMSYCYH